MAIPSRRAALAGLCASALAGCGSRSNSREIEPIPGLRTIAPFPVGCATTTALLNGPLYAGLFSRQFSQLTPEWEMKMEYILGPDGGYRFDAPDALAAFAASRGMRLFGTTLVWHAQSPVAFERLQDDRAAFAAAYDGYIAKVASRYLGRVVGWDVVNEPVAEDGEGLRDCLWSRNLGAEDYMVRAFERAAEADPGAVRFINDYNLENLPAKRATFLRLVERLLKRGAPVSGIGTQTHIDIDLPTGAAARALNELAAFGLPVHISELDVSLGRGLADFRGREERLQRQAGAVAEVGEAYLALPAAQRFALTVWGLRDSDSWLTRPPAGDVNDRPLLFDDAGGPKPAFGALAHMLSGRPLRGSAADVRP